jgi:hypothetical protein
LESLERREVLSTDLQIDGFYSDGTDLKVAYTITGELPCDFQIALYASPDGVTFGQHDDRGRRWWRCVISIYDEVP